MTFREPPHNEEAEKAVIGSILLDPGVLPDITPLVSAEAFYTPLCRRAWTGIQDLDKSGVQVNMVALCGFLKSDAYELTGLADSVVSVSQATHYAKIVAEQYARRQSIDSLRGALDGLYGHTPLNEITARVDFGEEGGEYVKASVSTREVGRHMMDVFDGNVKPGITTGYESLDLKGCRFFPGELIVIGARPGVGKTALAMNIAQNIAKRHPTGFVSMEMPRGDLIARMAFRSGRVSASKYRSNRLDKDDLMRIIKALEEISALELWIDDTRQTIESLIIRARRQHRTNGLRLLVIDYLQLLTGTRKGTMTRAEQVGMFTREMKLLAKELEITVLLLSQLNRAGAVHPGMENLKESGAIEENADQVWLIHRKQEEGSAWQLSPEAQLGVVKNRHGETGKVDLYFEGQYYLFRERDVL